jgi:integrase
MASQPPAFPVTDPELDAPDGAVVDGYERVGDQWVQRDGLTTAGPSALALADLVAKTEELAREAKANSTRAAYRTDWDAFSEWCTTMRFTALPASPETVAMYLTHLSETPPKNSPDEKRKVSTIARAMAAICHAHSRAGIDPPPTRTARVKETMAGLRRRLGVAPKRKTAVRAEHVLGMVAQVPQTLVGLRDRAILLVGFAGAFRRSELVGLDVGDLEFAEGRLKVTLRRSKTDQEGKGRKVGIPRGSSNETCPVFALQAWLETAEITNGPVFRAVNRHWKVSESRLTAPVVALVVKRYAAAIGLTTKEQLRTVAGHSLRSGLVTSAARAKRGDRSIRGQTGHKDSRMVDIYVQDESLFEDNAAEGLL